MIINTKTKQGYNLKRLHSKLGEIITWEVLSNDKKIRIAVIRQLNDQWITRKIGWQEFKIKYWLGTIFWERKQIVAKSREDILNQLLDIRKP